MPLIFSYGSLQDEQVQLSTFGRRLSGQRDELVGCQPALVAIDDPRVVAALGKTHHNNVELTGDANSRVAGMAFEITEAELVSVDGYEAAFAYERVAATLASGRPVWVYVHAPSRAGQAAPKPDFSGTWRFNPAQSALQITAPDTTVMVIDHRDPVFRISRTHARGEAQDTFSLDLTTDGTETVVDRGGLHLVAHARWDGDTLVFETRLVRDGVDGTNVVRYTLSADRRSFTADERFRSASVNYDNIWIMEKVEG